MSLDGTGRDNAQAITSFRGGTMGTSCLSIKLVFFLSLSLSSSSSPSPYCSSFKPQSPPKATASDLLSLLATKQHASSIDPQVAISLRSCFKFLVPFTPTTSLPSTLPPLNPHRSLTESDEEDQLVWWPPQPVMELARLSVDSGGDPAAIQRTLDPIPLPVPDIEGSYEDRCELTRTPYGRRFVSEELNSYFEFLFKLIAARGPNIGFSVSLNRYDLFHGHLFLATGSGRLGVLFHAKEYPAFDKQLFPYNMGYCQIGSNVSYGDDSMNLRNILWLAPLPSASTKAWLAPGVLVVLDAHPEGIIYRDLIPDYVQFVRTLYENDFGDVAVDLNYLNVGSSVRDYQLFIC